MTVYAKLSFAEKACFVEKRRQTNPMLIQKGQLFQNTIPLNPTNFMYISHTAAAWVLQQLMQWPGGSPGVVLQETYPTMSTRFSTYSGVILGLFHIHVIGVSKQSRFGQVQKGSILTCSIKECWNASWVVTYLLYCWAICDCKVTSLSTSE